MQTNQDWDIKPRGCACAACATPFADQQPYVSHLAFGADGYVRRDYCGRCWAKLGADALRVPDGPQRDAVPPSAPSPSAAEAPAQPPPADEVREGTVSVWKGVFHPPPPPPEEALKKETADSLLRKLIAKNDPSHANVIFILAVMLERRRVLVERDVQHRADGGTLRVYEHRATGDTFLVTDPQLDLNRLEQVQEEVLAMLGGKAEETSSPENVQHPTLKPKRMHRDLFNR